MIKGSKAQRILLDKAYARTANRTVLKRKRRDSISHKAVPGRPLCPAQKRIQKLIGKQRFRVEGCFGTSEAKALWVAARTILRGRQNPRADGHGRHLADLAQGRKPDHLNKPRQLHNAN